MIPSFVKVPVSLAQQIAVGALHLGFSGVTALLHRVLPGGDSEPEAYSAPPKPSAASAEPASPPRPPQKNAPAKKAAVKKAPAKKAPAKKAAPTKPAATLDEPVAPVDDDPVVYSSGPDVAASLPTEDLEALRDELQ